MHSIESLSDMDCSCAHYFEVVCTVHPAGPPCIALAHSPRGETSMIEEHSNKTLLLAGVMGDEPRTWALRSVARRGLFGIIASAGHSVER